eukprot:1501537-Prymnesium_polylepis.1
MQRVHGVGRLMRVTAVGASRAHAVGAARVRMRHARGAAHPPRASATRRMHVARVARVAPRVSRRALERRLVLRLGREVLQLARQLARAEEHEPALLPLGHHALALLGHRACVDALARRLGHGHLRLDRRAAAQPHRTSGARVSLARPCGVAHRPCDERCAVRACMRA